LPNVIEKSGIGSNNGKEGTDSDDEAILRLQGEIP
jgi:hypothetical protein